MKLVDVISQIKSGDIITWANETSWMDKWISFWTRSPYDHVAVAYWTNNTLMFAQAGATGGVYMTPALTGAITAHTGTCYWIPNNLTWNPGADSVLNSAIGMKYSVLAEVEVGLDMTPPTNDYICSIYAAKILNPLGLYISPKGCTPKVVVAACLAKNGGKITEIE